MKPRRLVLLAFVACPGGAPVGAQDAGDLSIQVGECIALESPAERYACFDRKVEAAREDAAGTVDAEGTPAAAASAEAVGNSAPVDTEPGKPPLPEPIVSSIATLSQLRPNQYLIELENGQTWRQVTTQRYALRVGREVTIYATRWGDSYRLQAADANDFIQVERVR